MISIILWSLLAIYLAIAAVFLSMWKGSIGGGWMRPLCAALSWPALLVVLWQTWRRGD